MGVFVTAVAKMKKSSKKIVKVLVQPRIEMFEMASLPAAVARELYV
jgi:hypothetical protein